MPDNKQVYINNFTLDYIFDDENGLGISKYLDLCAISSLKDSEKYKELEKDEAVQKQIVFSYAVFINLVLACDKVQYVQDTNCFRIYVGEKMIDLSEEDMNIIMNNFKEIYCLTGGSNGNKRLIDEAKPITEQGKKDVEIFKQAIAKVDATKNGVTTIDSMIAGIASKTGSPYNYFNIWDLTVWQLFSVHAHMYKEQNIYFTNIGIYTGNINAKENKIKPKDMSWSCRD